VDPDPITSWLEFAIAIIAFVSAVGGVIIAANRVQEKRIKKLITETTLAIQPGANGGRSLNDLHLKFDGLNKKIERHIQDSNSHMHKES
jgi:hypothetical protein